MRVLVCVGSQGESIPGLSGLSLPITLRVVTLGPATQLSPNMPSPSATTGPFYLLIYFFPSQEVVRIKDPALFEGATKFLFTSAAAGE